MGEYEYSLLTIKNKAIMFCNQCGNELPANAAICMKCGVATGLPPVQGAAPIQVVQVVANKSRTAYVLLGLFLGGLGIHNFYAGYTGKGVAQLLITLLIGWWMCFPLIGVCIWVLVEICTVTHDAQGNQFS
jgi:TM2 domain-containing membrane protein YozV/ribosomal protein L40E